MLSSEAEKNLFGYICGTSSYAGGTATIQKYGNYESSTYYIPDTLKAVTVTGGELPYAAFYNCAGLSSITIGNNVTSIGENAFYNCTSLTSITIPNSVTNIGSYAFYKCTGLTSVTIPDSVTSIGYAAFSGCSSLESMTIPFVGESRKTASSTYQYPFGYIFGSQYYSGGNETSQRYYQSSYYSNSTYYIPGSLKTVMVIGGEILYGAFHNCTSITSINIPDNVTAIGDYAFRGCTRLTSITIPNSVTNIGSYAFSYCTSLTSVTIPDSITWIGTWAFKNCTGLTSVTIPDSITWIASWAFENCTGLTSVTIGNGVTSIGDESFAGCTSLISITIPDSVTDIDNHAFDNCRIKKLIIAEGSKTVTSTMVICANSLTEVVISDTVTTIEKSAFSGCSGLTSITIPNSVTTIGSYAFSYCTSLTSILISDNVTSVGYDAFYECKIEKLIIAEGSKTVTSTMVMCENSLTEVIIPDNVTTIGSYAFSNCSSLTSITIPDSITSIADSAFGNCNALTTVYYQGELLDRLSISIGENNTALNSASWQYGKEHIHSYVSVATEPTCITQGYTTHTCACGNSYKDSYVNALGHDEIAHTAKAATCTELGWDAYVTCSRCNYSTYKEIAATGHSYTSTVVKPTFADKGYTQYTCHCGDSYKTDYKDALTMFAPNVSIKADSSGKQVLSWNRIGDGVVYEIHRATKTTGTYTKVATVAETIWTDTTSSGGTTYYYKVKAVYQPKPTIVSDFSGIVSQAGKCTAPAISVQNDTKGKPHISWAKVSGAKKYTVYRATSETGKYSKLGTTTKLGYTDSKASAGTTYYYKVIANASKSTYNSGYSNIVSCPVICGTPSVTVKIDSTTGKPSLSWGKVSGAAKYAVYRDGQLLTTVTAVTYADTTAAIDTQYTYAVQALGKTEDLNGAVSKAVAATSGIAKPDVKGSIDAVSGKPVLTWEAVEGAVKYEVYRSTKSNKSYVLIDTVEGYSYTDETVSAGKTYYYQVKAIGEVSKSALSAYDKLTGKCATPVISATNDSKGMPVVSWSKITSAKKYTVYRATSEAGKYTKLGTTTKLSYTDTKATPGIVYYYKVIANASSSKYNSGYSNIVSCGCYCGVPAVKVSNNSAGKVTLSWSKISGAVKYEIYLLGAQDYVTLGIVTGTSWTDTEAGIGEGRYYGVRAIAAKEDYNSEVSEPVFGRTTCATPKITGKVGINKKPIISWGAVEGATKYIIYRSTSSSKGFTVIGETEDLSWEDLTAVKGKTYYHKVVAVGDNCQSAMSSYVKVKSK